MSRSVHALKTQKPTRKTEAEPALPLPEILLGRKIKLARTAKGMRLRELAERTELSESLLSKLENDKAIPSLSSLPALPLHSTPTCPGFSAATPTADR
jgi:ribosome-binding protein aMBF1 (putative translation factor)